MCFLAHLYSSEIWILTKTTSTKLKAFKLCLHRKILNTLWTEKVTNFEVLRRMGKEKELFITVKCRKLQYWQYVTWNNYRYDLFQHNYPYANNITSFFLLNAVVIGLTHFLIHRYPSPINCDCILPTTHVRSRWTLSSSSTGHGKLYYHYICVHQSVTSRRNAYQ